MADAVKRMRYFNELFLTQEEFNLEQNYHLRMRRVHNRQLHTPGIINGLTVSKNAGAMVTIDAGVALCIKKVDNEELGFEIVVPQAIPYSLASCAVDFSVYLCLSYQEEATDENKPRGGEEKIHWSENPVVTASKDAPTGPEMVLLAVITLKLVGTDIIVDAIDTSACVYAGSYGKVVLPVANGSVPKLPVIEGKKIGSDAAIELNAPQVAVKGSLTIDKDVNIGVGVPSNVVVNGGLRIGSGPNPGNKNVSIEGNVSIGGNLNVSGTSTTVNTQNIEVQDSIIRVNKYAPQPTPATVNGGIEVYRGGTAPNAQLIWDETADRWKVGTEGNLGELIYGGQTSWEGLTNAGNADGLHKHAVLFGPAGAVAASVDAAGNVGIGTQTPAEKLHVNDGSIKVENKSAEAKIDINDRAYLGVSRYQDGLLALRKNQAALSPTTVFLNAHGASFINGGNVGIGNAFPAAKLDIGGSLRVNGGTVMSKILSGSMPVVPMFDARSRYQTVRLNFPSPFIKTPRVILTVHLESNDIIIAQTRSIYKDHVDVLLYCVNAPMFAAPMTLDWIAIEEDTSYSGSGDYDFIGVGGDLI